MKIELNNIIPITLDEIKGVTGDIWNKNISIIPGDIVQILAPSGAGKSTLIDILYGVRSSYKGNLLFDNKIINGFEKWSEIRTYTLAVVFQDLELLDNLTVLENINLKNQLTNHFTEVVILEMLNRLDINNLKDQQVCNLSKGEKQRVAIIRSLCMPFSWLLLDEPFSALDDVNTRKALCLIKEHITKNNSGVILANLFKDEWFNYTQTLKLI